MRRPRSLLLFLPALIFSWAASGPAWAEPASLPPPPPAPPAVTADLEAPEAYPLTALDRDLLHGEGYLVAPDGGVFDGTSWLPHGRIHAVLLSLKDKKRREVLSEIEGLRGSGGAAASKAVSDLLAENWELVGSQERAGINGWLESKGLPPVRGPDLGKIRLPGQPSVDDLRERIQASPPSISPPSGTPARPARIKLVGEGLLDGVPESLRPPGREEVARRLKAVDTAVYPDPETGRDRPYPESAKRGLREIMTYASEKDSAAVLRLLATKKPAILDDPRISAPFAWGHASMGKDEGPPETRKPHVVMPKHIVFVPDPSDPAKHEQLPYPSAEGFRSIGLPAPNVLALDPAALPTRVERRGGVAVERFADGSYREARDPEANAGLLLHELLHLETHQHGAGCNQGVNELRSFLAMNRLWHHQAVANGEAAKPGYGKDRQWWTDPKGFREDIIRSYMRPEVGAIRSGDETVAGHIKRTEKELALPPSEFARIREDAIRDYYDSESGTQGAVVDALVRLGHLDPARARVEKDRIRAEQDELARKEIASDFDYRKMQKENLAMLKKDLVLEREIFGDDDAYHAALRANGSRPRAGALR